MSHLISSTLLRSCLAFFCNKVHLQHLKKKIHMIERVTSSLIRRFSLLLKILGRPVLFSSAEVPSFLNFYGIMHSNSIFLARFNNFTLRQLHFFFFFFIVAKSNNKMGINTKTTLYYFQSLIIMELQNNVVKHIQVQ